MLRFDVVLGGKVLDFDSWGTYDNKTNKMVDRI
jgi:hypothetical protein